MAAKRSILLHGEHTAQLSASISLYPGSEGQSSDATSRPASPSLANVQPWSLSPTPQSIREVRHAGVRDDALSCAEQGRPRDFRRLATAWSGLPAVPGHTTASLPPEQALHLTPLLNAAFCSASLPDMLLAWVSKIMQMLCDTLYLGLGHPEVRHFIIWSAGLTSR